MAVNTKFLNNRNILVTRPQERAENLCQLISAAGGHAIAYPVIEILPLLDNNHLINIKDQLHQYDVAIFISPTAVVQTLKQVPLFPEQLKIAAIGSKTAQLLQHYGIHVSIHPDGHNSESLLSHYALQTSIISDKKILIFRGQSGRAFLGDSLTQRGAQICYVESYRRSLPDMPPLSTDVLSQLDAITINSNESLNNLMRLNKHPAILSTPVIIASDKAAKNAESYGFKSIYQAKNATDEACLSSLKKLFN